jgi:hypothetical protein
MLNFIDSYAPDSYDNTLARKVDECCVQLEELLVEWKLEALMSADDTPIDYRCLLADHISKLCRDTTSTRMFRLTVCSVNIYTVIIGLQRLVTKSRPGHVTLRAARRVADIIFQFHTDPALNEQSKSITNQ